MNAKPSTKVQLIEAALRVIEKGGVGSMTLEAVAAEAHVSKGGLLYHFPNKETLIEAMLSHYFEQFELSCAALEANDTRPNHFLRAFVNATFAERPADITIASAEFAAIASHPQLAEVVKARYQAWYLRALEDGIPRDVAQLVITATDGLWYAGLFNIEILDEADRERLRQRLIRLIEEA